MNASLIRGFDVEEFESRLNKTQKIMHSIKLDAILLTTEANIRYYSGFHTQFWHSPTRPWFLIIPAQGKPIAIIPEIGRTGMESTWIDDIYTWSSPNPKDDGVTLLTNTLNSLPKRFGRIGLTLGEESYIRMPFNNFIQLKNQVKSDLVDISIYIHKIKQVKSEAEINKIRRICKITNNCFSKIPNYAKVGMTERDICKQFKIDMLSEGADDCPYVVAGSGENGYNSIIMGPTNKTINSGDVLIIDTGSVWDGYFSDFDRNWAFEYATENTKSAYRATYEATTKGFEIARPGKTTSDIYDAMWNVLKNNGAQGSSVGRLGHGLGMELTERPSHTAIDGTTLKPGMVLTLEPSMTYDNQKLMVHEEVIVITESGAEWLTTRASPELIVIN